MIKSNQVSTKGQNSNLELQAPPLFDTISDFFFSQHYAPLSYAKKQYSPGAPYTCFFAFLLLYSADVLSSARIILNATDKLPDVLVFSANHFYSFS